MGDGDPGPLEMVMRDLRSQGIQVTVLGSATPLALQIGDDEKAVMTIALHDPDRPSFDVSYPALRIKRNGDPRIETIHSSGVLVAAILWIARELEREGVVRPEHE